MLNNVATSQKPHKNIKFCRVTLVKPKVIRPAIHQGSNFKGQVSLLQGLQSVGT